MAETFVETPGQVRFFAGHGPAPVLGPCPHDCRHNAQSVIAWGPDERRYELMTCDVDDGCAGRCRGWHDVSQDPTRRQRGIVRTWWRMGEETPLPYDDRTYEV